MLRKVLLVVVFCGIFSLATLTCAEEEGAWGGVDVSVIEKVALEHGQKARTPFINTDQGDLLLFVFLLAGVAGGFVVGYYWRILFSK